MRAAVTERPPEPAPARGNPGRGGRLAWPLPLLCGVLAGLLLWLGASWGVALLGLGGALALLDRRPVLVLVVALGRAAATAPEVAARAALGVTVRGAAAEARGAGARGAGAACTAGA